MSNSCNRLGWMFIVPNRNKKKKNKLFNSLDKKCKCYNRIFINYK